MKADECRAAGIIQFRCSDFEFTLDPNWEPPKEPVEVNGLDTTPETGEGVKRGKDGLTPQEQLDNYGVVLDARE